MSPTALSRRDRIGAQDVAVRAARFPVLAEMLSQRLAALDDGRSVAVEKAPRLLALLAQEGRQTEALLIEIEEAVREFDADDAPGWPGVRRRLAAERRAQFMPVLSEIVAARWARSAGFAIEQFEPLVSSGRRADLMLDVGGMSVIVEVATPTAPADDWTERANPRLRAGLERVRSGLVVEVDAYDALRFEVDEPWGVPHEVVEHREVDAVVSEFARAAAQAGCAPLPAELVSVRHEQPVRITAVGRHDQTDRTAVVMSWSRSGLVPPVDRLCTIVEHEIKQVSGARPSMVLVDLSCWSDFRGDGYYLGETATKLCKRRPRPFVGTFDWRVPGLLPIDRRILAGAAFAPAELSAELSTAWG